MALRSLTPERLEKARTARQQILVSEWLKRARLSYHADVRRAMSQDRLPASAITQAREAVLRILHRP
jgi:hypothetical protein